MSVLLESIVLLTLLWWVAVHGTYGDDILVHTKLGSLRGTRQQLDRNRLMVLLDWVIKGGDERVAIRCLRAEEQGDLGRRVKNTQPSLLLGQGSGEIVSTTIDTFINVPYAQPPIGQLRFKLTEPLPPWHNTLVLNATLGQSMIYCFGYASMAAGQPNNTIQEDCLYLGIYSPYQADQPDAIYPVMIYIHGGSYYVGSGYDYDGSLLAARGVVVVTINYRLADLGLLASGDSRFTGNYGIMDQVEALRWVKQHIQSFRGDVRRITIFGASAGAASVGWMLISPLTEGLFHGAIMQSGTPLSFWALYRPEYCDQRQYFIQYLTKVGCRYDDNEQIVNCLRGKSAQQLTPDYDSDECVRSMRHMPRVDGYVIPMTAEEAFRSGKFHKVPVIIGCTREEVAFMVESYITPLDVSSENATTLARYVFSEVIPHMKPAAESIAFEYSLWEANPDVEETWRQTERFLTDWIMLAPSYRLSDYLTNAGVETHFYMFMYSHVAHDIPEELTHRQMIDTGSVLNTSLSYHGFELNFVWGADEQRVIPTSFIMKNEITEHGYQFTPDDRKVANAMMTWWTNFAKNGKPSRPNDGMNVEWLPYRKNTADYLEIDARAFVMKQRYRQHKVKFWNDYVEPLLAKKSPAHSSLAGGTRASSADYGDIVIPRWTLTLLCALLAGCVIILIVVFVKVVRAKPKRPKPEETNKSEGAKMI